MPELKIPEKVQRHIDALVEFGCNFKPGSSHESDLLNAKKALWENQGHMNGVELQKALNRNKDQIFSQGFSPIHFYKNQTKIEIKGTPQMSLSDTGCASVADYLNGHIRSLYKEMEENPELRDSIEKQLNFLPKTIAQEENRLPPNNEVKKKMNVERRDTRDGFPPSFPKKPRSFPALNFIGLFKNILSRIEKQLNRLVERMEQQEKQQQRESTSKEKGRTAPKYEDSYRDIASSINVNPQSSALISVELQDHIDALVQFGSNYKPGSIEANNVSNAKSELWKNKGFMSPQELQTALKLDKVETLTRGSPIKFYKDSRLVELQKGAPQVSMRNPKFEPVAAYLNEHILAIQEAIFKNPHLKNSIENQLNFLQKTTGKENKFNLKQNLQQEAGESPEERRGLGPR